MQQNNGARSRQKNERLNQQHNAEMQAQTINILSKLLSKCVGDTE